MDYKNIEKQNAFCDYCMSIQLPSDEWKRYRFIDIKSVKKGGEDSHTGSLFATCNIFKDAYAKNKGIYAEYDLFKNYMQAKEFMNCQRKVDQADFESVLSIIEKIDADCTNILVYFPFPHIRKWSEFKSYHLQHFMDSLFSQSIMFSIDLEEIKCRYYSHVVIFEFASSRKTIKNNIEDVLCVTPNETPNLLYISLLTEVDKMGNTLYFAPDNYGRMFRK